VKVAQTTKRGNAVTGAKVAAFLIAAVVFVFAAVPLNTFSNLNFAKSRNGKPISAEIITPDPTDPEVPAFPKFEMVSAGATHNLALGKRGTEWEGTIWSFGNGADGRLGHNATTKLSTPTKIKLGIGLMTFNAVAAGADHSIALDINGNIWTWGANASGQLGDGTITTKMTPTQLTYTLVPSITGVSFVSVFAGAQTSAAIDTYGNVWTWGKNTGGYLGLGDTSGKTTPQIVHSATIGNNDFYPTYSVGVGNVTAGTLVNYTKFKTIELSSTASAIDTVGDVWTFDGAGYTPQKITTEGGYKNFRAREAGDNVSLKLTNGLMGDVYSPLDTMMPSTYKFTALSVSADFAVAISANGKLLSYGENSGGQLGTGDQNPRDELTLLTTIQEPAATFLALSCGTGHTLAIDLNGDIWAWGVNGAFDTLGLGVDEDDQTRPVKLTNYTLEVKLTGMGEAIFGKQFDDISVYRHGLGITAPEYEVDDSPEGETKIPTRDGELYSWGSNEFGQLGLGDKEIDRLNINKIATPFIENEIYDVDGRRFVRAVAGQAHSILLDNAGGEITTVGDIFRGSYKGYLWTFGDNRFGQCGSDQTGDNLFTPYRLTSLGAKFVKIASGYLHTIALDDEGCVWTFGNNEYGQLGYQTTNTDYGTHNATASDTRPIQTIPQKVDPELFSVPNGDGTTTQKKIKAISAGQYHNIAIDEDGKLWTWGRNGDGQLGTSMPNRPANLVASYWEPRMVTGSAEFESMEFKSVSAGFAHNLAMTTEGIIFSFGNNQFGQLGLDRSGTQLPFKQEPSKLYTHSIDSTMRFSDMSAGFTHSVALRYGFSTIWAWGSNDGGQIGQVREIVALNRPVQITKNVSRMKFSRVIAAYGSSFALSKKQKTDNGIRIGGDIWSWGNNSNGQLGLNSKIAYDAPMQATFNQINEITEPLFNHSKEHDKYVSIKLKLLASQAPKSLRRDVYGVEHYGSDARDIAAATGSGYVPMVTLFESLCTHGIGGVPDPACTQTACRFTKQYWYLVYITHRNELQEPIYTFMMANPYRTSTFNINGGIAAYENSTVRANLLADAVGTNPEIMGGIFGNYPNLDDYIVNPKAMIWQQRQPDVMNASKNNSMSAATLYDKIWLPSSNEIGDNGGSAFNYANIWNLTQSEGSFSGTELSTTVAWLRSTDYYSTTSARSINTMASPANRQTSSSAVIRPAMHIDLSNFASNLAYLGADISSPVNVAAYDMGVRAEEAVTKTGTADNVEIFDLGILKRSVNVSLKSETSRITFNAGVMHEIPMSVINHTTHEVISSGVQINGIPIRIDPYEIQPEYTEYDEIEHWNKFPAETGIDYRAWFEYPNWYTQQVVVEIKFYRSKYFFYNEGLPMTISATVSAWTGAQGYLDTTYGAGKFLNVLCDTVDGAGAQLETKLAALFADIAAMYTPQEMERLGTLKTQLENDIMEQENSLIALYMTFVNAGVIDQSDPNWFANTMGALRTYVMNRQSIFNEISGKVETLNAKVSQIEREIYNAARTGIDLERRVDELTAEINARKVAMREQEIKIGALQVGLTLFQSGTATTAQMENAILQYMKTELGMAALTIQDVRDLNAAVKLQAERTAQLNDLEAKRLRANQDLVAANALKAEYERQLAVINTQLARYTDIIENPEDLDAAVAAVVGDYMFYRDYNPEEHVPPKPKFELTTMNMALLGGCGGFFLLGALLMLRGSKLKKVSRI
jgi:alpha-tubulin suppressor-like RCC1 family protein